MKFFDDRRKISECKLLLEDLLKLWPKSGVDPEETDGYMTQLKPYVTDNFDPIDLVNRINGVQSWVTARVEGKRVLLEFRDPEGQGYRQRAIFVEQVTGGYLLEELRFECPICFGEGKWIGGTCDICRGIGWGAG